MDVEEVLNEVMGELDPLRILSGAIDDKYDTAALFDFEWIYKLMSLMASCDFDGFQHGPLVLRFTDTSIAIARINGDSEESVISFSYSNEVDEREAWVIQSFANYQGFTSDLSELANAFMQSERVAAIGNEALSKMRNDIRESVVNPTGDDLRDMAKMILENPDTPDAIKELVLEMEKVREDSSSEEAETIH